MLTIKHYKNWFFFFKFNIRIPVNFIKVSIINIVIWVDKTHWIARSVVDNILDKILNFYFLTERKKYDIFIHNCQHEPKFMYDTI